MGARERWIRIDADGAIHLMSDNDGWRYMRRGSEEDDEIVTLDQLCGSLKDQAILKLQEYENLKKELS